MKRWQRLCSALAVAVLLVPFSPGARGADAPAVAKKPAAARFMLSRESATTPTARTDEFWVKRQALINSRIKKGNIDLVFIGDSITHAWETAGSKVWDRYYGQRNAANLGIGADRTENVLWRLDHGNLDGIHPKLAVIMIGTNNATAKNSPQEIADGVKAIVVRLQKKLPEMKILLLAIFPRGPDENYPLRKVNEAANELIAKMGDDKRVFFLDIGAKFLAANGQTLTRQIMPDLLHPSERGYEIWAEAIEPKLSQLMGVKAVAPGPKKPAPQPAESTVTPKPREGKWMARQNAINERVKQGNVDLIFVGDSITQGWERSGHKVWEKYYGQRHAANLGISGDRTEHVLWRLDHGNLEGIHPKLAVVMIGTNNASAGNTPQEIAAGVKAIVERLRKKLPETKVLLLAIFPRGPDENYPLRKVNTAANDLIAKLADDKMVFFLDIGAKFLAADGQTLTQQIMPDLLHPREKGYEIWAEAIEPKVRELMAPVPTTQK